MDSLQRLFENGGFETRDLSLRSVYNVKGQTDEILTGLFIYRRDPYNGGRWAW